MIGYITAYELWKEGEIGPDKALHELCNELGEIESSLTPLERERQSLRAQLSEVVDALGGKVTVNGFGELRITSPAKQSAYDTKLMDAFVEELYIAGRADIADRLVACRKVSMRVGSLRIEREKGA